MRLLIDEMFPPAAARRLRDSGLDADHVAEVGLRGATDAGVAAVAREHGYVIVTENVADFANETDLVLVFVLKRTLPAGKAQAASLARVLRRWAQEHPRPYVGHHWPG